MKNILTILVLSFVVALGVFKLNEKTNTNTNLAHETAYDRVMRTKTLRCGYVVLPPTIIKDPKTGTYSGIMYDIVEEIASRLQIKVEWTEEATWATYMEGLYDGRYDVLCAAAWASNLGEWARAETVGPLYYSAINVWVRSDDHRFDNNIDAINDPNVTIASIDGTIPGRIAATDFPKAKILSLPQAGEHSLNLLNVVHRKADLTMVETYTGNEFLANNPNSIRNVTASKPMRVYPNVFLVSKGEYKLQTMLQMVLNDMQSNGIVDAIIKRYEKYPNSLYRVQKPYQPPQS